MGDTDMGAGKEADANRIVKSYMGWASGAGLIPLPLVDLAAITAVQLKMVQDLSRLYEVPFSRSAAKAVIGALLGSGGTTLLTAPVASLVKVVPFVGQIAGLLTEPALAAAATYALGKVFTQHFESGGTFLDFNAAAVRRYYQEEFQAAQQGTAGKA